MTGFLSDFLSKAKQVTCSASRKTDEQYRLSKLKLYALKLNIELKASYEVLGARVHEMYTLGEEDSDELLAMAAGIDVIKSRIAQNERRIRALSHRVVCSACGTGNRFSNFYCSFCGQRLTATEEQVPENENETIMKPTE